MEIVHQIVGHQSTHNADQHDRQPIGPGDITFLGELKHRSGCAARMSGVEMVLTATGVVGCESTVPI